MATKIALVGYRASGKSSVGFRLAQLMHLQFYDTDDLLVKTFQKSIKDYVAEHGWTSFREQEAMVLNRLSAKNNIVVATGGGIVESEENRAILKRCFFTVWLKCSVKEIVRRLQEDLETAYQRPSLTGRGTLEEVEIILNHRNPLYEEVASCAVDTNLLSVDEICNLLLDKTTRSDFEKKEA